MLAQTDNLPLYPSGFTLLGMDLLPAVGPALLRLRERSGLTQEQLAARAKLTPAMLSRYERGARTPHLKSLSAILFGLNVDFRDLAEELDPAPPLAHSGRPNARWVAMMAGRPLDEAQREAEERYAGGYVDRELRIGVGQIGDLEVVARWRDGAWS